MAEYFRHDRGLFTEEDMSMKEAVQRQRVRFNRYALAFSNMLGSKSGEFRNQTARQYDL